MKMQNYKYEIKKRLANAWLFTGADGNIDAYIGGADRTYRGVLVAKKEKYSSWTGLSRAGYVDLPPLGLEVGTHNGYARQGHTPIRNKWIYIGCKVDEDGARYDGPIVVTNGTTVLLLSVLNDVRDASLSGDLREWAARKDMRVVNVQKKYYDPDTLVEKTKGYNLYPNGFRGINMIEFSDWNYRWGPGCISRPRAIPGDIQRYGDPPRELEEITPGLRWLGIYSYRGKAVQVRKHRIVSLWASASEARAEKIHYTEDGYDVYVRESRGYEALIEKRINGKWYEWEKAIDVEHCLTPPSQWIADGRKNIRRKVLSDQRRERERRGQTESVIELMRANPEVELAFEDSYAVGNCEGATADFAEKYELTPPVKIETLLCHPKLDEMLKNTEFQNVVYWKMQVRGGKK